MYVRGRGDFYLSFLASSNKAFRGETLEWITVGGAFISPLKLISTAGGIHYVEFPTHTQHTGIKISFFLTVKEFPNVMQFFSGYMYIYPTLSNVPQN